MGRKRNHQIIFWVNDQELEQIRQKMEQLGTENMSSYLRKQAIDGYIVKLDMPELREMISLLRRSSNNLNQIARRVNETGRFYSADMEYILKKQEQLWEGMHKFITQLAGIR